MTAEREEHLIREAAFLTALDELIGCLDRSKAMQKVADVGHSVIGAKTCTVRLLENEGRELVLYGARGATEARHGEQWQRLDATGSIAGHVLKTGEAYECADIQADPYYAMKDFAEKSGLKAILSVPILLDGAVSGVITTYFSSAGDITQERKTLAQSLARFAARIVEIERRFSVVGDAPADAIVPQRLVKAATVNDAALAICERAVDLSGCDAALLFMPEGILGDLDPCGETGHAWVLATGEIKALAERAFTMRAVQEETLRPEQLLGARFAAAFPCLVGEQRIAVLAVANMTETCLADDVSWKLRYLSTHCAETLLRLKQAEQLRDIEDLLLTLGVGRDATQNPAAFRTELLNLARRQLGVEGAVLYLLDKDRRRYVPQEARGLKNIERPIAYASEGYELGEGFVGKVAAQRQWVLLEQPELDEVEGDKCLQLLRRQTHTRELTICLGVPLESPVRDRDLPPVGVLVLVDGRPGAKVRSPLEAWRGATVSALAAQISAALRMNEILRREDIFWTATHQAKNPLAKINAYVEAIRRRGPRNEYLDGLDASAREAGRMVDQILHIERIHSEQEPQSELADVSALVSERADGFRTAAEVARCQLQRQVEPGCLAWVVPVYVAGILDNLVHNSVKYTQGGSGLVEVKLYRCEAGWQLEVLDNGPGLPHDVMASIQDADSVLVRASPGRNIGVRSGLGLFIVVWYAKKLAWKMEVTRRKPHGTTFAFKIPGAAPGPGRGGR